MRGGKPQESWRSVVGAVTVSVGLAVVTTLLIAGYFRQQELGWKVVDLESRLRSAEVEARDAANRTTRAREQATELIDFFVENLREELDPIGRTDIIESAASHAKMLLARAQAYYDQGALAESVSAFD